MSKRIALLIHALHGGGAERLMSELATRWSVEHEIHLITWSACNSDGYAVSPRITRHGLNLVGPSQSAWQGLTANIDRVSKLRRKITEINPDALLSFCDQMNISALAASRRLPIQRWIAEHSDPRKQKLSRAWEVWRRLTYPTCSGCVVLTEGIASGMERWIPRNRMHIIPPAINDSAFATEAATKDGSGPSVVVEPGKKTLLYVGRLSREKRVDLLLTAWQRAYKSLKNWQLLIAGSGSQELQLRQQAETMKQVIFTGWCDQPAELYNRADLFVLASDYEGFPVALLEAMSHGLPCLATESTDALQELNRMGTAISTVPPGDEKALAKALVDLAEDAPARASMSENAIRISRLYSWQQIGKLWDQVLKAMLDQAEKSG